MITIHYEESLHYLRESYGNAADTSLTRMRALLRELGNPHEKLSVIHVAGTNGKGSTCVFLNQILVSAGYSVGLFTSPHLVSYNERIAVNNRPLTNADFASVIHQVKQAARKAGFMDLYFFEILTAAAFYWFNHVKVDFAIMETGLGGRLDMTNVVSSPLLSVICEMGYDHMEWLGTTLEQIAYEKAGIIKTGCPVAVYEPSPVLHVFKEEAWLKNAPFYATGAYLEACDISFDLRGTVFSIKSAYFTYHSLSIQMLGAWQVKNAAHVLLCIHVLREKGIDIRESHVRDGLALARCPARFELRPGQPDILLDGSHNGDGGFCFRQGLELYFSARSTVLVVGMLKTKDFNAFMKQAAAKADYVICTTPSASNALPAEMLAICLKDASMPVWVEPSPQKALRQALGIAGANNGLVAVTGSLYLAADVHRFCQQKMDG